MVCTHACTRARARTYPAYARTNVQDHRILDLCTCVRTQVCMCTHACAYCTQVSTHTYTHGHRHRTSVGLRPGKAHDSPLFIGSLVGATAAALVQLARGLHIRPLPFYVTRRSTADPQSLDLELHPRP